MKKHRPTKAHPIELYLRRARWASAKGHKLAGKKHRPSQGPGKSRGRLRGT